MNYIKNFKVVIKLSLVCLPIICFAFCMENSSKWKMDIHYPSLKSQPSTDTYFGNVVIDKYRVLENTESNEVQQWIKEEKNLCDSVLSHIPFRDSIRLQIEDVTYSSNERGGFPRALGKKLFFFRSYVKEKMQKILYKDSVTGKDVELFSTGSLNKDGKLYSIDFYEPSWDGKYLAFGLSVNGDEMSVIRIMDLKNRKLLPDSIERASYGTSFWIPGTEGFFYQQLKEIKSESDKKTKYEDAKVKLHVLGTNPLTDKDVFSTANKSLKLDKIDFPLINTFPNSENLIAYAFNGTSSYMALFYSSINYFSQKNKVTNIKWNKFCSFDEKVTAFSLFHDQLFTLEFKNNPNGTIKKYNLKNGLSKSEIVIDAQDEILEDMLQTTNSIYIKKLKNGISSIIKIDLLTGKTNVVKLPFSGYVYLRPAFNAQPSYLNSDDLYYAIESWDREVGVYMYNPHSNKTIKTNLRAQGRYGNPENLIVKEIEISSYDGIQVPLSIIYKKDTKLDGNNPTLLEGYGTYGISTNATFNLNRLVWLNRGGIYAVAHVRGGGEKGDAWYKAGYKSTKANSWKDFIACAEFLIHNKYTSASRLAARGASAGGITVGRAITENPEYFKAAILDVAVLNTLRSEKTGNSLTIAEYGSTTDSIGFKNLFNMDVYHHIRDGVKYPSLLISAGVNDPRVDFWQPAKAVARFQDVSDGKENVVLFKITGYGHSGDISDRIKNPTDDFSFLFWQLTP